MQVVSIEPNFQHLFRTLVVRSVGGARPAHVSEAIASSLGFRTHAALIARSKVVSHEILKFDAEAFRVRLVDLAGIDAHPNKIEAIAFEALVTHIADLADAAREENNRIFPSRMMTADEIFRIKEANTFPSAIALVQFLEAYPAGLLVELEALMYVGRDGGSLRRMRDYLTDFHAPADRIARDMAGKAPLAKYLRRGLRFAKSIGLSRMWTADDVLVGTHRNPGEEEPAHT